MRYSDGDLVMYNIYASKPLPRGAELHTPEMCNKFVTEAAVSFKKRTGLDPTLVLVPEDYTGDMEHELYQIKRAAKPLGHYYIRHSEQDRNPKDAQDS